MLQGGFGALSSTLLCPSFTAMSYVRGPYWTDFRYSMKICGDMIINASFPVLHTQVNQNV